MKAKPKLKLTKTERYMAENQVAFRNINQRVPKGFKELLKIAEEENQTELVQLPMGVLYFICECFDEDCRTRIPIKLSSYNKIHKYPDRFCVAKGHTTPQIEDVISKHRKFDVVRKRVVPKQDVQEFKKTPIQFD